MPHEIDIKRFEEKLFLIKVIVTSEYIHTHKHVEAEMGKGDKCGAINICNCTYQTKYCNCTSYKLYTRSIVQIETANIGRRRTFAVAINMFVLSRAV